MASQNSGYTYGVCPCTGTYEARWVEVNMTVGGQPIRMRDVPQGACPQCGSRVYKAEVLIRIDSMMKGEPLDRIAARPFGAQNSRGQ